MEKKPKTHTFQHKPLLWPLSNLEVTKHIQKWPFLEFFTKVKIIKSDILSLSPVKKSYVFYLFSSLCVSSTRPQNTNNSRSMFPSVAIYICAKFLNKSTKWHFYIGCVFVWHIFCAPVVSFTRYGQVQVVFIK